MFTMPTFSSNYHSLQASLQKKFKGNNLISANYTWSKALSNLHFPAEYSVPQVTSDVHQDYGPTRYNRGQEFNHQLRLRHCPGLANQQGLAGHVLGGWELSGIIQVESGAHLTAGNHLLERSRRRRTAGQCASRSGCRTPTSGAPHNATEWFNTAAFQDVPCDPSQYSRASIGPGNARIGSILGPGLQSGISRCSRTSSSLRGWACSSARKPSTFSIIRTFSGVDTTVGSSTYGTITSAHDNRIMQLGLKLNF